MGSLPFSSIPDAPMAYTATTVMSRMMDGLGYRYFWASEGLTDDVLDYRAESSCRSLRETLEHIHNLVQMIEYSVNGQTYPIPEPEIPTDVDVRFETLSAIERLSQTFRNASSESTGEWKARFKMGENHLEFPYWNMINGPMSDAIYHTGQVVSQRRAAGLPMNSAVNVFTGHNDS